MMWFSFIRLFLNITFYDKLLSESILYQILNDCNTNEKIGSYC